MSQDVVQRGEPGDGVPEALVDPMPPDAWVFGGEDVEDVEDVEDATPPSAGELARNGGWAFSLLVGLVALGVTGGVLGLLVLLGPMAAGAVGGCGGG